MKPDLPETFITPLILYFFLVIFDYPAMQMLGGKQKGICNQTVGDCNQTKATADNWCLLNCRVLAGNA